MRITSKENKQVYTGIASAPNQQQLDNKMYYNRCESGLWGDFY